MDRQAIIIAFFVTACRLGGMLVGMLAMSLRDTIAGDANAQLKEEIRRLTKCVDTLRTASDDTETAAAAHPDRAPSAAARRR